MSSEIKKPGIVIPVIHLQSEGQAVSMAEVAMEEGATGVFLIDHNSSTYEDPDVLGDAVAEVSWKFPELWVGVNCLGLSAFRSLEFFGAGLEVDGVWTDNALDWRGRMNLPTDQAHIDEEGPVIQHANRGNAKHFGGLSMKGIGYIVDDREAATFVAHAQKYVDVVTTSGVRTGAPMSKQRAEAIRAVLYNDELGPKPLALASGVDVNNIRDFVGPGRPAQHVLVGSSIETHPLSGIFDREKLHDLMSVVMDLEIAIA